VVTTDQLFAPFLSSIATGWQTAGVICPSRYLATAADFAARFDADPIGTGPYRLKSFGRGVATLERYDRHWGGPPRLDRILVRLFDDHEAMLAALAAGEIQVVDRTGIPGEHNLEVALAIEDATVLEFVGQTWGHLDIKQVGPWRETLVRQALDYATPKDRIIEEVLGGEAVPAVADQSPAGPWVNRAITPRPYDRGKARELLERAGFAPGEDGVWARGRSGWRSSCGGGDGPERGAGPGADRGGWTKLGVETRVRTADRETLYGPAGFQFTDTPTAGYYRWANVNDPDDMFYWHSSQIPTSPDGAGGNFAAYFNPYLFQAEIDELTSRAAAETDPVRRKQLYLDIQAVLHREVPALFVFWDKVYAAAADTVGGFWPSARPYLLWDARVVGEVTLATVIGRGRATRGARVTLRPRPAGVFL
jgi:peptide/nickel transport system substrate-binding protein